jgi:hypothetical protein
MNTDDITIPENLQEQGMSSGEELIPAEVAARKAREEEFIPVPQQEENNSSIDTTAGYTVSAQGLVNNYAVTPAVYEEEKSLAEKRRDYTMLGIVALAVVTLFIGAAIAVNVTV